MGNRRPALTARLLQWTRSCAILTVLWGSADAAASDLQSTALACAQRPATQQDMRDAVADSVPASHPVWPASACPSVFGDSALRMEHRERRREALEAVEYGPHCIDLVHVAHWHEPTLANLANLELIGAVEVEGCKPLALVGLPIHTAEEMGCEPGVYLVGVDDAIGDTQVLEVSREIVLLEGDDGLSYLRVAGEKPVFRMWWHPSWSVTTPSPSVATSPKRPTRRPASRRSGSARRR